MPAWLALIIQHVVVGAVLVVFALTNMLGITWIERKVIGRLQDRIGANRAGPFGLLQPLADMVKILTKEDITPTAASRVIYNLGPLLVVPPALLVFAVLPFGAGVSGSDLNIGLLYIFAVASTSTLGILIAGWGSNNKYSLLGAMRAVAQMVSYEVPQALSIIGIVMLSGSLSLQQIVQRQSEIGWFVLLQPLAFVIFLIAAMAEVNRTPFDLPEAESEIIAGHHTEYSGLKFGMFYLAEYINVFFISALAATLFLGGYQIPFVPANNPVHTILGPFVLIGKTFAFVFLTIWLRGTLPRVRVDHLMGFAWKALVPLCLLNIFMTAVLMPLVGLWSANLGISEAYIAIPVMLLANAVLAGLVLWWAGRSTRRRETRLAEQVVPAQ
ncbi:MAG: NADH-quinone oxidoreductase subunit NuoH [Anaerolineae bacterium]|nr:NADH-quinone oxidoreductase subunit NuoH [Anaerolineae bacterium]